MQKLLKTSLFTLVIATFFANAVIAQVPLTPEKIEKERQKILAQKIDSVIVWEFALKNNKPEKKGRMDMLIRYDKNGNKVLEGRYNKDVIDTRQEFVYNDKNQLTETTNFMEFNTPGFTWKYEYDEKGRTKEAVYSSNMSNSSQRQTFHYREGLFTANDGVLTEVKFYITKDKVGYRDVITYDDQTKRPVKMIRFRIDDSIEKKEEYKYDANGNISEIAVFGGMEFDEKTAKLQSKKVFTYDANGNVASESETNAKNQLTSKLVHTYDASGKLAETTVSSGKKPPVKPSYVRKYVYAVLP
ncbi:MAG: hypothetical protein MUF71_10445 [Candidatus Kapabacteria bacterium]|jgi:YD repeat-containing protein|nr:hypothetical protein [Candidatus Kapabacteria bacterium]